MAIFVRKPYKICCLLTFTDLLSHLTITFKVDMNVKTSSSQVIDLLPNVLNNVCYQGIVNEKLRDEILCQLCNQTWNNDNDANNERGWLLMANCLSAFPPSKTLYKYLLK
jgi:hypothetical protein